MGVGDVVARNDIQYERYDLVRPEDLAAVLAATPGLGTPTGYGPPSQFSMPPGYTDEISAGHARLRRRGRAGRDLSRHQPDADRAGRVG